MPVGMGQGLAFLLVGSGLYIAPILHKHYPKGKPMLGNGTLKFFIDDGVLRVAVPMSLTVACNLTQVELNTHYLQVMFHSLNHDLWRVRLGVEADKVKLMHFWKKRKPWKPEWSWGPDLTLEIDHKIHQTRQLGIAVVTT